ncbi:MAG: ABC transporter ATP-binding protein [Ruminococcaceae bacterium]|nr:ABC transporter ATP-binding protein [Oscillospiraceae bacterium]
MILLNCEGLELAYDGKTVVSDLSFSVNSGDYLCIVGENGSGKSTLIKAILGLLKPVNGKICTENGLSTKEIGYLPQQTAAQKDFPASVEEVVFSGCLNSLFCRPFFSKAEKDRAVSNMKRLGIYDIRKKCYRELSGGQQQRVLLARALCASKKMILLDEPASGLDPLVTSEFYKITEELNREGMTVIMVTHDINCTISYASHILHMKNKALFFGTAHDYRHSDIGHAYFGGDCCHHD